MLKNAIIALTLAIVPGTAFASPTYQDYDDCLAEGVRHAVQRGIANPRTDGPQIAATMAVNHGHLLCARIETAIVFGNTDPEWVMKDQRYLEEMRFRMQNRAVEVFEDMLR